MERALFLSEFGHERGVMPRRQRGVMPRRLSLQSMTWRGVFVITATGELTGETVGELRNAVESSPSDTGFLVLDLRGLTGIDPAGFEAIARAEKSAGAGGRELLLVRPSSRLASWRRPPGRAGAGGPRFVDDLAEVFQLVSDAQMAHEGGSDGRP